MPQGYDSRVEERGSNFSGGQLQRLAIARAVLGNPAVMLLDEATSALDAEAEASVQQGLEQAMAGRTVFVIAHRLSLFKRLIGSCFSSMSIVEQGSHDELMRAGGRYSGFAAGKCSTRLDLGLGFGLIVFFKRPRPSTATFRPALKGWMSSCLRNTNPRTKNPILTFEGKRYDINALPDEVKSWCAGCRWLRLSCACTKHPKVLAIDVSRWLSSSTSASERPPLPG